jgi:hypothetical protein
VPIPPLPEALTAVLQLDRTAALAAAFVIGTHHADVLQWVARTICGDAVELQSEAKPKANAAARRGRKANTAARKSRSVNHRLAARDEADEQLIEAMKASPGASIGELSAAIERSRTTTVTALHRLRAGGVAESVDKVWRLVEPEAPREPPERWIEPLSAAREHRAHA